VGDPSGLWQLPLLFAYVLVLGGPLGEEYGWRGFLLPRLLERRLPALAALIVRVIWSAWHLPLFFIDGTIQSQVGFGWYSLLTMGLSVVYTYLFLMTEGSVVVATLLHTAGNLTAGVLPLLPGSVTPGASGQFPVFAVVVAIIAAGLLPALRNR
jgi:membrane protease YdiL (CAAX protease family)